MRIKAVFSVGAGVGLVCAKTGDAMTKDNTNTAIKRETFAEIEAMLFILNE